SSEGGAHVVSENKTKSATSGADGTFRVTGLGPGVVTVTAKHADFAASEPIEVTLENGHRSEGNELKLRAAGRLEGVAYDAEHRPLGGGRVTLTPAERPKGDDFRVGLPGISSELDTTADVEGKFAIANLAPGRYFAEVKEPPRASGGPMFMLRLPGESDEPHGV